MNQDYFTRWVSLSAKDEKDAFRKVVKLFPEIEGKKDIRGFPFGRDNQRNNLRRLKLENANLSYSKFINCNMFNDIFRDCIYVKCNFTEIRQWDTVYNNCEFINCDFNNAAMGVNCQFTNCKFIDTKLHGRYFNFGSNSKFTNCEFNNCKIQSCQISSITFTGCNFTSVLRSVRFMGKFDADIEKRYDRRSYPTTLLNCSFIGSKFINVEVFLDIIDKNNKWPLQKSVITNNDRKYYE